MNTQEKLQRIRAKCVELLAIAEKRTPGKWILTAPKKDDLPCYTGKTNGETVFAGANTLTATSQENASFIASCAGSAEAGWRATIAAIDCILDGEWFGSYFCDSILAAWPEELL